jgi:uncharacterized protein with NAD-binding domain and iron-sulfur cluster
LQDIRNLDNISFEDWFKSHGGSDASIKRMWDPIGEHLYAFTAAGSLSCVAGASWTARIPQLTYLTYS